MRLRTLALTPARVYLDVWERGLSGALTVVRVARELLEPEPELEPRRPPAAEPRRRPAPEPRRARRAAAPPPPTPPERPRVASAPVTEPEHVDEEPVLVAEVAEAGAEDGAGAELHVDAPWPGYERMTVPEIRRRLASEGPAAAGAVKLYEAAGRQRRSVIEAADQQLAG